MIRERGRAQQMRESVERAAARHTRCTRGALSHAFASLSRVVAVNDKRVMLQRALCLMLFVALDLLDATPAIARID